MNNASGGDGIPVELFQILEDDAVKVVHSIWQQIWRTQQWPQDWKRSVFIPVPKKGNAKECSNYRTIALISHASKVLLKLLQARLQWYVNRELPDVQAGFRKGRGTRNQIVFSLKVISLLHSLVAFKIISLVHIYLVLLNYRTIALISHASKVMLKFSKPGFNSTWTMIFQMFELDLEKAEEPEITFQHRKS